MVLFFLAAVVLYKRSVLYDDDRLIDRKIVLLLLHLDSPTFKSS